MRTLPALTSLLLLFVAPVVHAQCPATPKWALGRDPKTCDLIVDGGPDYGQIRFDEERGNYQGPGNSYRPPSAGANDVANGCPTSNTTVWGSTLDNYSAGAKKDEDVSHVNTNSNVKYLFIRDSVYTNAWVCKGGAWSGPNGHRCAAGENSAKHTDVLQLFSPPEDNGWIVLQNSDLTNGDQQIGIWQSPDLQRGSNAGSSGGKCPDRAGTGGMLWHNVKYGNSQSFVDDCFARGGPEFACASGNQFVVKGDTPHMFGAIWLVGVQNLSGAKFRVMSNVPKIIVVGGSGGRNGWPGPLGPGKAKGPGGCPNGKLSGQYNETGPVTEVYCYASIERAISAGHRPPPFLHLSAVGWERAPDDTTPPPPEEPPPTTEPPPPVAAPVLQKLVLYNADTDRPIFDPWTGQPIDSKAHPRIALEAVVSGNSDGSVAFALDGAAPVYQNSAPFGMDDCGPSCFEPWGALSGATAPAVGNHTLVVTPFGGKSGAGTKGQPVSIPFAVAAPAPEPPPPGLALQKLVLYNADTDRAIFDPWTGQAIDLRVHPRFAVDAIVTGGTAGSVAFALDGEAPVYQNSAPFGMDDCGRGCFEPWGALSGARAPGPGSHSLVITPFTGKSGAGTAGASLSISFNVAAPVLARPEAPLLLEVLP